MPEACVFLEGRGSSFLAEVREWLASRANVDAECAPQGPYVEITLRNETDLSRLRKALALETAPEHMIWAILPESERHPMGEWLAGPGQAVEREAVSNSPGRHTRLSTPPADLYALERSGKRVKLDPRTNEWSSPSAEVELTR
jgi:hypothetical protein